MKHIWRKEEKILESQRAVAGGIGGGGIPSEYRMAD
jgi:hypothetical protein